MTSDRTPYPTIGHLLLWGAYALTLWGAAAAYTWTLFLTKSNVLGWLIGVQIVLSIVGAVFLTTYVWLGVQIRREESEEEWHARRRLY